MFGGQSGRPAAAGRRTLRDRKVSQRMAVVDESARQQAVQARLEALEADNDVGDDFAAGSDDDEFVIAGDDEEEEEVEISGKKKRKKSGGAASAAKRKTRAAVTGPAARAPRSFARLIEEAQLDKMPAGTPTYLTAQAGPSKIAAARKFCSVCGNASMYKCARCGSRYCCRRCHSTHVETRCLKFIS